jgi:hypothetical protein
VLARTLGEKKLTFVFVSEWELRDIDFALGEAKKARFEHGQTPKL